LDFRVVNALGGDQRSGMVDILGQVAFGSHGVNVANTSKINILIVIWNI